MFCGENTMDLRQNHTFYFIRKIYKRCLIKEKLKYMNFERILDMSNSEKIEIHKFRKNTSHE